MRTITKKLIWLPVLLVLAVGTAFAQHTAIAVVPGSKGALPEVPKLPQLQAGLFAGLDVTFVNGDYVNLSWPNVAEFGGAEACTLMYRVSPDGDWNDYTRMDAIAVREDVRGVTMAASMNFDSDVYDFKLVLHGGDMDGYESNIVTAERCSMSSVCKGWSISGNQDFTFVGMKLGASYDCTIETYTNEGEFTYTSEDGYYTYQWYRRNPNTYEMVLIEEATEKAYTPSLDDYGYEIIQCVGGDEEHCSFTLYKNYGIVELPVQASFEKFYVDGFVINTDYDIDPSSLIMVDNWTYGEENKSGKTMRTTKLKAGQYEVRMSKKEYDYQMLNVLNPGATLTSVYEAGWMDEPWYREVQIMSDRYNGELVVKPQLENVNIPATIDVIGKNIDGEYVVVDSFYFATEHGEADNGEAENGETENGEENGVAGEEGGMKSRRTRGVDIDGDYLAYFGLPEGSYYVKARKTDAAMETYYPSTLLYAEAEAVKVEAYDMEKMHQQPDVDVNGDGQIDENDYYEYQPATCIIDMKPAPAPLQGSGTIEGSVVRMEEVKTRAWADTESCRVYLKQKAGDVIAQTEADANGGFQFKNVPFGDYQVLLDITCCTLATIQSVTLTESAPMVASLDYVVDGDDIILKSAVGDMLALSVIDEKENALNNSVIITWYNEDKEQIAKGSNLRGLEEGTKVYYSVMLDENLGRQYREVLMQEATFESTTITCQLEKIGKVKLEGRISALDIETNPADVFVIQKLNGKYEETFKTTTSDNGTFSIEVFDDVTDVTVSRADCSDATVHRESIGENSDLGIIPLSLLSGVYLTVDLTYQPAVVADVESEDVAILGGLSNFDITIKNGDTEITDFIVQNSSILIKSGATIGNTVTMTLKNKQGLYADAVGSFVVREGTNNIMLDTKELGGINATANSQNVSDVGYVYDETGALAARATYTGEELNIVHLPSGAYTLISMKASQVLGNVQTLASLDEVGLKASDYVKSDVTVQDGVIAAVAVGTIPSFDENSLSRITDNTYFNVNKTSTAVGEYLTFTSFIELKDVFAQSVDNIALVIDLPAGCSFLKNSAMIGRKTADYNESGNRVTINLTKTNYQDKIRFCVIPEAESEYTMAAYVALDQVLQPIGSTQFVAKGFPISAPERTASTKITVSGKAPVSGTIKVYDNDVLIGSTTAYWQGAEWSAECELNNPYDNSFHSIYAKIKSGESELASETKSVEYDPNMIAPASATILYYNREFDNTYNIKFDYEKGTTSHNYYYFFPFKYDDWWIRQDKEDKSFTFVADFTQNDPDKIKNIYFKVLATDGTIRTLPGTFDSKKQAWVATTKYWSSKLPINVSLDYDMLVSSGKNHEDGLLDQAKNMVNMSNQIYQYLQKKGSATKVEENEKSFSFIYNLAGINTPFYGSLEELDYTEAETLMQNKQFNYAETDNGTIGSFAEWNNKGISAVFADLNQKYAVRLILTVGNAQTRADITQEELNTYIGNLAKKFSNGGFNEGIGTYANTLITIVGASEYFSVRKDFENMLNIIENYSSNYNQLRAELSISMNAKNADGSKRLSDSQISQMNTLLDAISKDERDFILKYYQYMEVYQQKLLCNVITDVATSVFGLVLNKISGLENFQTSKANEILLNYQTVGSSPSKTVDVLSYGLGLALNGIVAENIKIADSKDFKKKRDYILEWSSDQNLAILKRYAELKERIREALKGDNSNLYDEAFNDNSIYFQAPSTEPILDPSGYVYEGVLSNRLPGVTTTVYYKDETGAPKKWNAEDYGQENPLITDENGFYQWNVPNGEWQVKYEKEGYETVTSEWMPVPPPQLDVNQGMTSATPPAVNSLKGYEGGIVIDMSKYMTASTFNTTNVIVTRNGAAQAGKVELDDPEGASQSDGKLATKFRFVPETDFVASDEVIVTVHKEVQSYCGIEMAEDYQATVPIESEVKKIEYDENLTVDYQGTTKITVSVLPKEASVGKKLNVKTSSADIVSLEDAQADIDEDGKASVTVTGELLGDAYITFEVAGTDVSETTKVTVVESSTVETAPITIGKSGKASYCGDKSLDFSYSEEVKAYIATGFDKDEGTIWLTRVKDVPAGVPVLIKGEANKTYDVPVTDSENSYYTNMFVGNTSGASIEIYETSADGSKVNYYLKDGTFLSVTGNAKIGKNKCYLQLPATFNASVTGASQSVTVGQTGKASFAASVDLDFTNVDGLKAFTATGYDKSTKTIWLTRVMKVQQGEGVLLKGNPDNYEIPSAAAQSHYENMFVGNTSGATIEIPEMSDDGSQTNYYLKNGTFLSVTGNAKIGNNKCYLALPTSMVATGASTRGSEESYKFEEPEMIKLPISFRSLGNDGDGTTGIHVQSSMFNVQSDAYYTLQGQRVVNPGKGLYIKNGKKVVIK
jgi:hypothetical protein